MKYEIRVSKLIGLSIIRTDDDGKEWSIPEDPANADYRQYLTDTDGGLPVPEVGELDADN
jgi:hypothetical protein